jgi:hypothetical protein
MAFYCASCFDNARALLHIAAPIGTAPAALSQGT